MHGLAHYTKVLMILLIIGLFTPLMAQGRDVVLSNSPNQLKLQNSSDYGFELRLSVDKYLLQHIDSKAGSFDEISIEGYGYSSRIGEAQLPMTSRIVAVPLGAVVKFEILSQETRILGKKDSGITRSIFPAQPSVSKSADLSSIVFEQNAAFYARNEFNQSPNFRIEEIGMMRGLRLFQFYFEPIRYNPVTGELEIVSAADIKVEFVNPNLAATQEMLAKTASVEFDALYAKSIFNYDGGNRASLVRHPTKMVILCPTAYTSNIQSYVDWKTQQGFAVNVVAVGSDAMVANTATAIKSYMQNLWNSATTQNPAPTYLLIIGDESGTITVATNTGATDTHVTDMTYVRLNGSDYLPEMYHGRFSVSNTTELANIINKTITYEKTLMPDLSYLGKTVLIAGADSGFAPTHGNGAINYATAEYFNTAHGITSNNYLYPASQTSDAVIIANANEGRGY
ncbi:MAG: C25 family cysteine peptidase, partial [Candidatus Cloacimonetes bacterium]|nr:C25 family cysteine peptidase [Candidatus Cloacimonadota bacterium]MDY0172967.1 C25 family cysteine peptidase [Candidatus Cloacimonadaceae bacterium]